MRNSKGFSLVSILVTTAIGGILAVVILTIIDTATRSMIRVTAMDNFESLIRTTAGVLANKQFCDNALRGATSADRIVYTVQESLPPNNEVTIQNIYIQPTNAAANATVIMSAVAGSSLSSVYGSIRVASIRFREKEKGVGRGVLTLNGVNYTTYRGEVEIRLTGLGTSGADTVSRRIPLTVYVDRRVGQPTSDQIMGCYQQDGSVEYLCTSMGGNFDANTGICKNVNNTNPVDCSAECNNPGSTICPDHMTNCGAAPPQQNCLKVYYMAGFDYDNITKKTTPICACRNACYSASGAGASAAAATAATATATATAAPAAPSRGN